MAAGEDNEIKEKRMSRFDEYMESQYEDDSDNDHRRAAARSMARELEFTDASVLERVIAELEEIVRTSSDDELDQEITALAEDWAEKLGIGADELYDAMNSHINGSHSRQHPWGNRA